MESGVLLETFFFSAKLSESTTVKLYSDRIEIERTKQSFISTLPPSTTVYFKDIKGINYRKYGLLSFDTSYISFAGLSPELSATSGNPHQDPYGIIFFKGDFEKRRGDYNKMVAAYTSFRENASSIQSNISSNSPSTESAMDKLKKLKELHSLGILTDAEYEEKRVKLISEI